MRSDSPAFPIGSGPGQKARLDTDVKAAPNGNGGTAIGYPSTPKPCPRCGQENEPRADRCRACKVWLPGNQVRRKHGRRARYQPAEIIMTADQLLDAVVADKGGVDELSALQRALLAKLRDVDILVALNKRIVIQKGLDEPAGRKGHDRLLACVDRFVRIAMLLGLDREAKQALTPLEYWQQRNPKGGA